MKKLIITEEDKKQILSLYKRCPTINEGAVCDEQSKKKVDITKGRILKIFPLVIKFWKDWLENPITKEKINKDNKFDDNQISDTYLKYFDKLDNLKLVFVGFCTGNPDGGFYAYVTKGDTQPNIYVSLWNNYTQSDEFIEETLVHEIQHLLYFTQPMSPELKIDNCFNIQNKKQVTDLKGKINNFLRGSRIYKIDYKNIVSSFGIGLKEAEKVYSFFNSELNFLNTMGKIDYIVDKNEAYSRVMEMRKKFKINPGENITTTNFKPFINKLLASDDFKQFFTKLNQESAGVYHFLLHWAYIGYPNLETLLNKLNTLAMQQNKQETYRFV